MTTPIFIVDDDMAYRYIISRSVQETNIEHTKHEFEAGDEFLEVFSDKDRYLELVGGEASKAMILLDINMPRMNGFEVLEALSKLDKDRPEFLVFMVTSSNNDSDREKSSQYDFVKDFIVKPAEFQTVQRLYDQYF